MLIDVMSESFKEQRCHEQMVARILSRPFKVPIPGYIGKFSVRGHNVAEYSFFIFFSFFNFCPFVYLNYFYISHGKAASG